jgi:hypothetical protein
VTYRLSTPGKSGTEISDTEAVASFPESEHFIESSPGQDPATKESVGPSREILSRHEQAG